MFEDDAPSSALEMNASWARPPCTPVCLLGRACGLTVCGLCWSSGSLTELITEAGGRVAKRFVSLLQALSSPIGCVSVFVPLERRSRVCGSLCYICDTSMCSGCSLAAHGRMNLPFGGIARWFPGQICHLWARHCSALRPRTHVHVPFGKRRTFPTRCMLLAHANT